VGFGLNNASSVLFHGNMILRIIGGLIYSIAVNAEGSQLFFCSVGVYSFGDG